MTRRNVSGRSMPETSGRNQSGLLRRPRPGRIAMRTKTGGEQCCSRSADRRRDARIRRRSGPSGRATPPPEVDKIKPGLEARTGAFEQDQRAQHRLHAEQIIELGRLGGDSGERFRIPEPACGGCGGG